MANTRISDLTAGSNLAATDIVPSVETAGVGPVQKTGLQLAAGLFGASSYNGATLTGASSPVAQWAQTWNNAATTYVAYILNVTDTASASGSLLMDLRVGGSSKFQVNKSGFIGIGGAASTTYSINTASPINVSYIVTTNTSLGLNMSSDAFIGRNAAAHVRFGSLDAASPVAQTISVQNVSTGTSNTAGVNTTINASRGTGTGAGGDIVFQVAPAGSSGTAQNTLQQALRINGSRTVIVGAAFTVATLPAAGTQGRRAWVTDATSPTFLGTLTGGGSVVCPVFDNGTAWVSA